VKEKKRTNEVGGDCVLESRNIEIEILAHFPIPLLKDFLVEMAEYL
jgi:hypothetical protein